MTDGDTLTVGGTELRALHTPGHSPGSVCWHAPELNAVFSGDTLFHGGPGATGRSYSDFPTILESISGRLGKLPGDTVVYTGHGDSTTIGDEIVHYDEWVAGAELNRARPSSPAVRSRGCGAFRPRTPLRSARRNPVAPQGVWSCWMRMP